MHLEAWREPYALTMSMRGSVALRWSVASAAVVLGLFMAGCAYAPESQPPSGADEPEVVAARGEAAEMQSALLEKAAMSPLLSVSVDDSCQSGSYSAPWGPFDLYYWKCEYWTSVVVGSDIADAGELIATYRAHLGSIGCEPDPAEFDQVEGYWAMYGVRGHLDDGEPYTVDDLPSAAAQCPDGRQVFIGFRSSAAFDAEEGANLWADEVIESRPHDQEAVRASGSPNVVVLSMRTTYHVVERFAEERFTEETPAPERCSCYSGSECDCPGG